MALSPHANFTNSLKRNNDIFPILTIAGSSTLYLSTRDVTVESQAYDGRLLNAPGVNSTLNFKSFSASTSSITLRIANAGYSASFGDRINKAVVIYYATNGTLASLATCLKIFTGVIKAVSKVTPNEISLLCEDNSGWRDNKILTSQVGTAPGPGSKMFRSLSYGAYDVNVSSLAGPGTCRNKKLRPIKFIAHDKNSLYYDEGLNDTGGQPHMYVTDIDRFVPIEEAQTSSTTKYSTNTLIVDNDADPATNKKYFKMTVRMYPEEQSQNDDINAANMTFNAIANTIDENTGTFIQCTASAGTSNLSGVFGSMAGTLMGTIHTVKLVIRGQCSLANAAYAWLDAADGTDILAHGERNITTANGWNAQLSTSTVNEIKLDVTSKWGDHSSGVNLDGIQMGFYIQSTSSSAQTIDIYEMFLDITTFIEIPDSTTTFLSRNQNLPSVLYAGTDCANLDGLTNISGSSPVDVHANLVTNFGNATIDSTTQSAIDGEYGDITRCTIDSGTMKVQDALLKLQREAGFISYVRPSDGTIHYLIEEAENRGSAPTVNSDLTVSDYRNASFNTLSTSDMLWKVFYKYDKHVALSTYLTAGHFEDTVTQSAYGFDANDNTMSVNNDWVNATKNAVNLLKLFKYPRVIGSCEILNPALFKLEIGDIVRFTDPPADFRFRGDDYTDYYFRIIDTQLTVNSLKIKAMEVYKS
tara:strand:+ start:103 stop:2196 length:2094 start_codon:yes stop_codon:yes gene_type:complete